MSLVAKMTREFGENLTALSTAIDDSQITKKEAERCLKELADVIDACVQLKAYLEISA